LGWKHWGEEERRGGGEERRRGERRGSFSYLLSPALLYP
jgi:hypothetical protein